MAGAFFGRGGGWPEQVWEAGTAFARFLEDNPSLAHILFVGTYAPPSHIERVHEFVLAFTLFVEGGNSYRPPTEQLPRIVTEAIVCSVLEGVSFQIRHDHVERVRGLLPLIAYMVFAPFMGAQRAAEFVDSKVQTLQGEADTGSATERQNGAPYVTAASAARRWAATRATCPSLICGKNGSASERAATSSQTGNSPSRWPKRSR